MSPFAGDQRLGAAQEWPQVPALLLPDSFEPAAHQQLWSTVTAQGAPIWVLLPDRETDAHLSTVEMLRRLSARLSATMSVKSLVVHDAACWSDAKWNAVPARFATQLWPIPPASSTVVSLTIMVPPLMIPLLLGSWETRRYYFHWRDGHWAAA